MKQTLQLRIGQQLTMTPQLQQAIRLLQLSSLDLQAEIQEALESNPLLEPIDEDNAASANGKDNDDSDTNDEEIHHSSIDTHEALSKEVVTKDLPVDTQWDNWDAAPPSSGSYNNDDSERNFDYQGKTTESPAARPA